MANNFDEVEFIRLVEDVKKKLEDEDSDDYVVIGNLYGWLFQDLVDRSEGEWKEMSEDAQAARAILKKFVEKYEKSMVMIYRMETIYKRIFKGARGNEKFGNNSNNNSVRNYNSNFSGENSNSNGNYNSNNYNSNGGRRKTRRGKKSRMNRKNRRISRKQR